MTEGRDQGTVAFPHAECKFFFTASAAERARRRWEQLRARGEDVSLEEVLAQQNQRDARDAARACGPLDAGRGRDRRRYRRLDARGSRRQAGTAVRQRWIDGVMGMTRPLWKSAGYQFFKNSFWLIARLFFRFRWKGREHFPRDTGALICANHQSYFDPVLVGICFRQQINFLARNTLFDVFLFGRSFATWKPFRSTGRDSASAASKRHSND